MWTRRNEHTGSRLRATNVGVTECRRRPCSGNHDDLTGSAWSWWVHSACLKQYMEKHQHKLLRLKRFQRESGCLVGDRPPPRDLSQHRLALEGGRALPNKHHLMARAGCQDAKRAAYMDGRHAISGLPVQARLSGQFFGQPELAESGRSCERRDGLATGTK